MFDANADAKGEFRRIKILTGPGRRRKWSAEAKAQVIAETLLPGACVSEVARRWQLCPQQVFAWRRAAQLDGTSGAPAVTEAEVPRFVPIVTESAPPLAAPRRGSPNPVIEVKLAP
jgi:transposase